MTPRRPVSAGADLGAALVALRFCQTIDDRGRQLRTRERALGLAGASHAWRVRQWERAAVRLKSVLLRYAEVHLKAGFNPNQPRWPAGSGRDSGRWSGGSGGVWEFSAVRRRSGSKPDGHHYVPHSLYRDLPLPEPTRKVFDDAKTGRLYAEVHRNSVEHVRYNEAVRDLFKRFVADNAIKFERMTPEQAKTFVDMVKRSSDPRIRNFNVRILLREAQYWIRRILRTNNKRPAHEPRRLRARNAAVGSAVRPSKRVNGEIWN
jgi:hypothetical protein